MRLEFKCIDLPKSPHHLSLCVYITYLLKTFAGYSPLLSKLLLSVLCRFWQSFFVLFFFMTVKQFPEG